MALFMFQLLRSVESCEIFALVRMYDKHSCSICTVSSAAFVSMNVHATLWNTLYTATLNSAHLLSRS